MIKTPFLSPEEALILEEQLKEYEKFCRIVATNIRKEIERQGLRPKRIEIYSFFSVEDLKDYEEGVIDITLFSLFQIAKVLKVPPATLLF